MSEENQFRLKFKYYKRKKPPPSFDNVIDPSKSDHTKLFDTLHNTETADVDNNIEDAHTNNVKDWKIAKFKSSPGLVFISNVFSKDDQLYWASKCLKDYSSDTYKRNIDHPSLNISVSNWWEESQRDKSLEDKLRWSTLGYHHDWETKVKEDS